MLSLYFGTQDYFGSTCCRTPSSAIYRSIYNRPWSKRYCIRSRLIGRELTYSDRFVDFKIYGTGELSPDYKYFANRGKRLLNYGDIRIRGTRYTRNYRRECGVAKFSVHRRHYSPGELAERSTCNVSVLKRQKLKPLELIDGINKKKKKTTNLDKIINIIFFAIGSFFFFFIDMFRRIFDYIYIFFYIVTLLTV